MVRLRPCGGHVGAMCVVCERHLWYANSCDLPVRLGVISKLCHVILDKPLYYWHDVIMNYLNIIMATLFAFIVGLGFWRLNDVTSYLIKSFMFWHVPWTYETQFHNRRVSWSRKKTQEYTTDGLEQTWRCTIQPGVVVLVWECLWSWCRPLPPNKVNCLVLNS